MSVRDTSRSSKGRDAALHDTVRTAVNRLQDAQEELQRNAQQVVEIEKEMQDFQ